MGLLWAAASENSGTGGSLSLCHCGTPAGLMSLFVRHLSAWTGAVLLARLPRGQAPDDHSVATKNRQTYLHTGDAHGHAL